MITVSVAMATYNGERFIREQLDSLATQRYLPSELVISDDASSDNTVAIAERFAKTAPFTVHIRRNNRVGYRANFMRAASFCTSDLIAFCDQDDIWAPGKLAVCTEPFRDPTVLLTYHNAEVVTEVGESLGTLDYLTSAPMMLPLSWTPVGRMPTPLGFTQVFRRSILEFSHLRKMSLDHNDVAAPMAHDQWVIFIASVFGNIVYIGDVLAFYRQHGSNHFGWYPPLRLFAGVRDFLHNPAEDTYDLQQAALRCAEILEKAKCNMADVWYRRATAGAARYRFLAELYAARVRLYTSPILVERMKAFSRIMSTGGYRAKGSWGLGRKALVRDLWVGLPAGHLLRSRGHQPPAMAERT
jgi:glycosyltransferase involved in cell wall biosynthesis